jgi:soluble lytic murein transglycosylase-like protein
MIEQVAANAHTAMLRAQSLMPARHRHVPAQLPVANVRPAATATPTFAQTLDTATAKLELPATTGNVSSRIDPGKVLPARAQRHLTDIAAAADRAGIDAQVLAALVWAESSFDAEAVSPAGAVGLAQLMPGTADALGVDPTDPAANLHGGARYLAEQLDRFGDLELALAAYNAGPSRVAAADGVPAIAETVTYVQRVSDYLTLLRGTP